MRGSREAGLVEIMFFIINLTIQNIYSLQNYFSFASMWTSKSPILGLIFSVPIMRDIFNFGTLPLTWFLGALGFGVFNFGLLLASNKVFNIGKYA